MATKNKLDKEIDLIYRKNCSNIQIDIFDIGKVFDAGRKASMEANSLYMTDDERSQHMTKRIVDFVNTIRKN